MKKNLTKKMTALALAFLMIFLAAPATAVYAVSPPPANVIYGTMQIEYRFAEGQTPNVPREITRFGFTYHLVSQTEPVLASTLPATRTYSYIVSGVLSPEQLDEIQGWYGDTVFTPVPVVLEREVDREVVLPRDLPEGDPNYGRTSLPTNDVDDIPLTWEFNDVASGTDPSGFETKTFDRTGVTFEIEGISDGLPTGFIATVVYRGIETYEAIGYFIAESTFTSSEEDDVDVYVIIANYETDEMPPPLVSITDGGAAGGGAGGIAGLTPEEETLVNLQDGAAPLANIVNGLVPQGSLAVTALWSFVSLLFSIAGVALAGFCFFGILARRKADKKGALELITRIMVMGFGLLTLFTWLLWDNFSLGMVWVNQNTPMIGVLLAVTIAISLFVKVYDRKKSEGLAEQQLTAEQTA